MTMPSRPQVQCSGSNRVCTVGVMDCADLKVSVRRQTERLRKELAVATGQDAALQDEIKRHELVYDMLDGRNPRTVPLAARRRRHHMSRAGWPSWRRLAGATTN